MTTRTRSDTRSDTETPPSDSPCSRPADPGVRTLSRAQLEQWRREREWRQRLELHRQLAYGEQ